MKFLQNCTDVHIKELLVHRKIKRLISKIRFILLYAFLCFHGYYEINCNQPTETFITLLQKTSLYLLKYTLFCE